MELKLTNEELDAIKYYKNEAYESINQLLDSDSRIDISKLCDENEDIKINYDKISVATYIETIKNVYSAILKTYLSKGKKENWIFSKKCSINEIDRLKNEPYIDNFLLADISKEKSENSVGINQVLIYICGDKNIPYIMLNDVLGEKYTEILIAPFTMVKEIIDDGLKIDNYNKDVHAYKLELVSQEFQEMSDDDKSALYNYIISNSDLINVTISNTVKLEKENVLNYESIRDLEKKISDLENIINQKEQYKDYSESERNADILDLKKLNDKLEILKVHSTDIFNDIKSNNKFITEWKKNIIIYLMAECADIEDVLSDRDNGNESVLESSRVLVSAPRIQREKLKEESFQNIFNEVKLECSDNKLLVDKLIKDINRLINRQQNFAKIAGNLGASYSALNNSFDMKSKAEKLETLINTIKLKVESLGETESSDNGKKLLEISEVNNQISILINYLNNPKSAIAKSKMNRFDEMIIVEENELKRDIARAILDIRGEAELKNLRDDTHIIEDKGALRKFIGIFTGQNKLDEFMIEQIHIRQNSIKRTLAKKLRLDHNYSVHEFVADIRMFIKDNEDDELILDDVESLKEFEDEISKNFVIINSKVEDIIAKRESKNLPVSSRISKKELIEIETYRFLNKYGYDIAEIQEDEETKYVDTTSNEISRIIDYINTSKIL